MRPPFQPSTVDLNEALALRILRSCPKALQMTGLGTSHREAICRLRRVLTHCARKDVQISAQNYPKISADEKCLLNALAAAQSGQHDLMVHFMTWLLPPFAIRLVDDQMMQIAEAFACIKITLKLAYKAPPLRREKAGLYAVIGSNLSLLSTG